jgi:hypothetical protein
LVNPTNQSKQNITMLTTKTVIQLLFIALLVPILCPAAWAAQTMPLAWDPNPDASVAGYVVYYGNKSGNYSSRIDVGTNTATTISGLKEGQTNYFAVTAYNAARVESAASGAVAYIVPGMVLVTPRLKASDPQGLKFPVAWGHWYEVQATADLKSWTTIWQTTAATSNSWVQFQDPKANLFPKRFYRLILH